MEDNNILAVVLAGGKSKRFGEDKNQTKLGDKTLLEHVSLKISNRYEEILIVSSHSIDTKKIKNVTIIPDCLDDFGPLAGVLSAMKWVKENQKSYQWIATFPSDTPFFETSIIDEYQKRIKIKESKFLSTDLNAGDFKESLCVFDDCDVISNKLVKLKVFEILNAILETGRHFKVSCIFTSHNANMGLDTKRILNESHSITIFPRNMGNKPLRYLLGEYLGFDNNEVKKLKKCNGRWVTICKTYPMTFFDEKDMYIKDMED